MKPPSVKGGFMFVAYSTKTQGLASQHYGYHLDRHRARSGARQPTPSRSAPA